MLNRTRKGNLLIVMAVFITIVLVLGGLFTTTSMRTSTARLKAQRAGDMESYITLANICADAFQADLEWQSVTLYPSVDNPNGWDLSTINYEVFDEALETMQLGDGVKSGLKRTDGPGESWLYQLTNPTTAIVYAGIDDSATLKLCNRLLENAEVSVTINSGLEYFNPKITSSRDMHEDEQVVQISDITYTVWLKKGITTIRQDYVLSGEMLKARYSTNNVQISVDGSSAVNQMVSQTATRTGAA